MINKDILTGEFNQKSFACPKCKHGTVILEKDKSSVLTEKNYGEIEDVLDNHGLPTSYLKTIAESYKCTEDKCNAKIIIVREEAGFLSKQNDPLWIFEHELYIVKNRIKYVEPSINIIDIPDKTPLRIKETLLASYRLYWLDIDACANKLRSVVELFLTWQKIKKQKLIRKNGSARKKVYSIPLSERIRDFQIKSKQYSKFSDQLNAIKWIGNLGSHANKKVEQIRIIEAYELIEYILNEIYDNRVKYIKQKTKEIIENKGRR